MYASAKEPQLDLCQQENEIELTQFAYLTTLPLSYEGAQEDPNDTMSHMAGYLQGRKTYVPLASLEAKASQQNKWVHTSFNKRIN